jgi:predicted DNA binding CopG/RHH family protein
MAKASTDASAEKPIRPRLPTGVLEEIKIAAGKPYIPYQTLIKVWLAEKVDAE